MNEVLTSYVAWRRRNIRHQYVGQLEAMVDRIRLIGRAPEFGIDVALSIPLDQITRVRSARGTGEAVLGERGIVLELARAEPIFLRELGDGIAASRLLGSLEQTLAGGVLEAARA